MPVMLPATSDVPSAAKDREHLLLDASKRYMSGELSVEEFEEAERRYMPPFRAAILSLAEGRPKKWHLLWRMFLRRFTGYEQART